MAVSPERARKNSRVYYKLNSLAKNRHDVARRALQRAGTLVFHDELRERIAAGEIDVDEILKRVSYESALEHRR